MRVAVLGFLLIVACGPLPDSGPDGGLLPVSDGGSRDGGEGLGCVYPRADRITLRATPLLAAPGPTAATVAKLGANTLVIPTENDDLGACPDNGYYPVQERTRKGFVLAVDTGDAQCTRGSAFDANIATVVRKFFGARGDEAVTVTHCESGSAGTAAVNGPHYGLFQMGSHERATYGDSICAEGESQAANAYFIETGSDWSPWSCKP